MTSSLKPILSLVLVAQVVLLRDVDHLWRVGIHLHLLRNLFLLNFDLVLAIFPRCHAALEQGEAYATAAVLGRALCFTD